MRGIAYCEIVFPLGTRTEVEVKVFGESIEELAEDAADSMVRVIQTGHYPAYSLSDQFPASAFAGWQDDAMTTFHIRTIKVNGTCWVKQQDGWQEKDATLSLWWRLENWFWQMVRWVISEDPYGITSRR